MIPDFEKYRRYVDHFDLTEEGKRELVHTVYVFMENSVDRALGTDPTQLVMAQQGADTSKRAIDSGTVVDLSKDEYHELDLTIIFQKEKGGE